MGAIIAVAVVLTIVLGATVTGVILYVRHKRANKPVPIDPAVMVKQIERSQHREWEAEYNRLMREAERKLPPGSRPLSLRRDYDPYDDDGETIEVRSWNGDIVMMEYIPNALAGHLSKADIEAWQHRARTAGLYYGPCDGVMGERTWAAMRELDRRARGIS